MTATTKNAVWQDLIDIERLVRYYSLLSTRYHTRHRWILGAILVGTMVGVASIRESSIAWVGPSIVALAVLFENHDRTRERAVVSDVLAQQYSLAMSDWAALWNEMNAEALSEEDVLAKKRELMNRIERTLGGLDERLALGANGDVRLNEQAADQTKLDLESRYATA